jgi:hypothetical protein
MKYPVSTLHIFFPCLQASPRAYIPRAFGFLMIHLNSTVPRRFGDFYGTCPSLSPRMMEYTASRPNHAAALPAPLHHLTTPSSPPETNAPADPPAGGLGRHDTLHTSPVSRTVDTAARVPRSHTLIVLSADLSRQTEEIKHMR